MASFNKVIIIGNLTRDPELRYTPKGTAVCKVGLAVNRKWRNEAGETKEEVTFIECDAFGKTAENIGQYMRKGRPMMIEGRLKLDQWDDKQTGAKRSKLGVVVETCQFLGSAKEQSGEAQPNHAEPVARQEPSVQPASQPADPEGDDVPF